MKNVLLASVAVAVFGLAGCASEDKMMKDDAMMEKDASMMKDDAMMKDDGMMKDEAMTSEPVTYEAQPATETMAKDEASSNPMMDLCFEKGGSIGEWAGADDATQTCDTPDGNSYPLAQLTSFEAFQ